MSNLKVGMNVIRIEKSSINTNNTGPRGILPEIKYNTVYEVKAVCYCSQCGSQKIDIGLILPVNINPHIECSDCKNRYPANGRWFVAAINFRPVQYQNISAEIVETLKVTEEKSDVKPLIQKQYEQA